MMNVFPSPGIEGLCADMAYVGERAEIYLDAVAASLGVPTAFSQFVLAVANVRGSTQEEQCNMARDQMVFAKTARGEEVSSELPSISVSRWRQAVVEAQAQLLAATVPDRNAYGALLTLDFVIESAAKGAEYEMMQFSLQAQRL